MSTCVGLSFFLPSPSVLWLGDRVSAPEMKLSVDMCVCVYTCPYVVMLDCVCGHVRMHACVHVSLCMYVCV